MKKSNLFQILSGLNKKEVRELRKWVQSPAHNQREDVILLFEFLVMDLGKNRGDEITKEKAFLQVFPNEKSHDDAKIRQTMHFLMKATEEFLVFREISNDKVKSNTILAKVYRKKRLVKNFKKALSGAEQEQEKRLFRNSFYYQSDLEIRQERITQAIEFDQGKGYDFQGLNDALDHMFLSSKLREICTMISNQNVNTVEYNTGLFDHILLYLEKNTTLLEISAIGIYYYGFKCSRDPDDVESFQKLKSEIFKSKNLFPSVELRDLYLIAINFCIRRMNGGDKQYFREAFELYNEGVEQEVLLYNGVISRNTFLNMVSIGAQLKEFDWLDQFIKTKVVLLAEDIRENISHYGRSRYYFEIGNYDEAMELLSQIEYDHVILNLIGKGMLVRIFYEKEYNDSLESLLESMRAYVQRKKVIGYHKSSFLNLIKYTRKLMKVNQYDQAQVKKLKEKVETVSPLPEKDWMLKQVDKLLHPSQLS